MNQKENDSCLLEKLNFHPPFRKGSMFNERFLRNVSHAFLSSTEKSPRVSAYCTTPFSLNQLFRKNISMGGMGLRTVLSYKLYKNNFSKGMSNKGIPLKKYIVVTFYKISNLCNTI